MKGIRIIRTKPSNGAVTISKLLQTKRNKLGVWEPRIGKYIKVLINWGNTKLFNPKGRTVLNKPDAVALAVNKIKTFKALSAAGIRTPNFYIPGELPALPPRTKKSIYVARKTVTGHSGQGIVVVRGNEELFPKETKLITEYIPKLTELRIHVAFGEAILVVQKRKRAEKELDNDQKLIRSYDNGWIFSLNVDEFPEGTKDLAIEAVKAIGLDFGAVDMVISKKDNLPYVLEINTAPAIEADATKAAYKQAFEAKLNGMR